jgi:hypothetical protein
MQKTLSYILFFVMVLAIGYSCKKDEIISDPASLAIGSYVTLVKSNNNIIDYSNLSASKVSIVVKEYGTPVDKIKLHVTKGTTTTDKSKWKLIKEVPYSGETLLEVSATEIAKALGIPVTGLEPGATYTIYNQLITKDNRTFDISNTFAEFAGLTAYNMALTWTAVIVCPFVSTGFAGNFQVTEDGWGDYSPGDVVTVTNGPGANQITLTLYPNPAAGGANGKPWVVAINPATGAATVASQPYGDYPAFGGYTNLKIKTAGTSNYVFSCVGTISLRLNHTGDGGNFGDYNLKLKKI